MATQILPELIANNRDNRVDGTARGDQFIVLGQMLATEQGRNLIATGTGDDLLSINGSLISQSNGVNDITMGAGNNTFMVAQDMLIDNATTQVNIFGIQGETESQLIVGGMVRKQGAGTSELNLSGGDVSFDFGSIENLGGMLFIGTDHRLVDTDSAHVLIRGDLLTTKGTTGLRTYATGNASIEIMGNVETRGTAYYEFTNQSELIVHGEFRALGGSNRVIGNGHGTVGTITTYFGSNIVANNGENSLMLTSDIIDGSTMNTTIVGALIAEDSQVLTGNSLELLGTTASLSIGQGIWTTGKSSYSSVLIIANDQTDVSISNGIHAVAGGSNQISISGPNGQAQISIDGAIEADADSSNSITLSAQQGHIELNGKVDAGALDINAVGSYDVLSLNAVNYLQFSNFYQNWLSDLSSNDAINAMNLEVIRVDIGRFTDTALNSLGWLDQLVDQHNSAYDEQIALELNIDRQGSDIQLGDLFTSNNGPSFSGLDMTGSFSNTLDVLGSLSDNGIDDSFLRVLGDEQDSVVLSKDWTLSQAGFTDETGLSYNVYSNATDELLIQSSISVV